MANISSTFVTEYENRVKHDYQKSKSRMDGKTAFVSSKNSNIYKKNRLSPIEANTNKARYAQYTFSIPEWNQFQVNPVDVYISVPIDRFDDFQTNVQQQTEVRMAIVKGLNRKKDQLYYDAMTTTTNVVTFASNPNQLPVGNVEELHTQLVRNEAWEEGQMFLMTSPAGEKDIRKDTTYSNNFHLRKSIYENGMVNQASGFIVGVDTALPTGVTGTTPRRRFAWHKEAVLWAENSPLEVVVEQIPNSGTVVIIGRFYANAVIQDPKGLFATDITTD